MHDLVRCALAAAAFAVAGCDKSDEPPRLPLGHPPLGNPEASSTLAGDARAALDSGNHLYAAASYALALEQYRRAAALAPEHDAPLFGIVMVANATGDSSLADSAATAMRARQGARAGADRSGGLPESHPPIPLRDTNPRSGAP